MENMWNETLTRTSWNVEVKLFEGVTNKAGK